GSGGGLLNNLLVRWADVCGEILIWHRFGEGGGGLWWGLNRTRKFLRHFYRSCRLRGCLKWSRSLREGCSLSRLCRTSPTGGPRRSSLTGRRLGAGVGCCQPDLATLIATRLPSFRRKDCLNLVARAASRTGEYCHRKKFDGSSDYISA